MDIQAQIKTVVSKLRSRPALAVAAVAGVVGIAWLLSRDSGKEVVMTSQGMGAEALAIQAQAQNAALEAKKMGQEFELAKLKQLHELTMTDKALAYERDRLAHERGMAADLNTFELSALEMSGVSMLNSQQLESSTALGLAAMAHDADRYKAGLGHELGMNTLWSNERVAGAQIGADTQRLAMQLDTQKHLAGVEADLRREELVKAHDVAKKQIKNDRFNNVLGFGSRLVSGLLGRKQG